MPPSKDRTRAETRPNRLIHEKSPYLLQHAHNPVDWYPWSAEAFEKAAKEDKPIFLSIGYSTCHWCHVMEAESFEDPEVARLMNDAFVSIKVDREERPDLDHVYMTVCQMMTGSGGWPLSILMTPDKRPFFAATYLPKGDRFGQSGMTALVPRIKEIWEHRRKDVLESADSVIRALRGMEVTTSAGDLRMSNLESAYGELAKRFDRVYGGFSQAPKFPSPHIFLFLLRYWKRTGREDALEMVEKTLRDMRQGGLYDQIGFGFHRYSTDREWLVPHFEKMLYDQAMLALAYLETYQATGEKLYKQTVGEIFTYVLRDMTAPEGGFYSAEDADSEGVEGKFYVWTQEEIKAILGKGEAQLVSQIFHVEERGNFLEEASRKHTGANILFQGKPLSETALDLGMPVEELEEHIRSAGRRLFEVRERRVHPHKDDKILTDWNGLMIAAFAKGARVLGDPARAEAAGRAADFILTRMRRPDGRLFHRYRDGHAGIPAHLDDYAFFIWGLIELYEATHRVRYLKTAIELNGLMLAHFWDEEKGGLFFAADDSERLIVRKKEAYDGAIPSGNGVAMLNLLRLARMTGNAGLEDRAAGIARAFSGQIKEMPSAFAQFLIAADFGIGPSHEVVIAGPTGSKETRAMLAALKKPFQPNMVSLFRPSDSESPEIDDIAPFVRNHRPIEGRATAYVCMNHACHAPTTEIDSMLEMLRG